MEEERGSYSAFRKISRSNQGVGEKNSGIREVISTQLKFGSEKLMTLWREYDQISKDNQKENKLCRYSVTYRKQN
jgi:hypothetical protein